MVCRTNEKILRRNSKHHYCPRLCRLLCLIPWETMILRAWNNEMRWRNHCHKMVFCEQTNECHAPLLHHFVNIMQRKQCAPDSSALRQRSPFIELVDTRLLLKVAFASYKHNQQRVDDTSHGRTKHRWFDVIGFGQNADGDKFRHSQHSKHDR